MKNNTTYRELAKTKISQSRSIVISSCSKGGYTIAQQLEANEEGQTTSVFLKGAFHVEGVKELYNLRDAINATIKMIEDEEVNEEDWDK